VCITTDQPESRH